MPEVEKVQTAALVYTPLLSSNSLAGSHAGEQIRAGDACYVGENGRVYRSNGARPDHTADVRGFAATDARQHQPVTLVFDITMRYGEQLRQGASLYLSGTKPGGLAYAPSPGGTRPIAVVLDTNRVHFLPARAALRLVRRSAPRAAD
jgi:hypothetical protein